MLTLSQEITVDDALRKSIGEFGLGQRYVFALVSRSGLPCELQAAEGMSGICRITPCMPMHAGEPGRRPSGHAELHHGLQRPGPSAAGVVALHHPRRRGLFGAAAAILARSLLPAALLLGLDIQVSISLPRTCLEMSDIKDQENENKLKCVLQCLHASWGQSADPDCGFVRRGNLVVSEFDLVCADSWMLHVSNMGFFVGWTAGSILFSCLAQEFGEGPCLLSSMCSSPCDVPVSLMCCQPSEACRHDRSCARGLIRNNFGMVL